MPSKRTTPRICADCHTDISERYPNSKLCKPCAKERRREQGRQRSKAYWNDPALKKREQERNQRYYQRPDVQARKREYQRKRIQRADVQEQRKAYYQRPEFKSKHRNTERERYQTDPVVREKAKERSQMRRSWERTGTVTPGILVRRISEQGGKCYWCGLPFTKVKRKPTIEHVIPRTKGGIHDDSNIVAACSPCNLSKNAKDPTEYAQSKGRLF